MSKSQNISFENRSDKEIILYIEPRGDEYKIKSGQLITIHASSGEAHHYIEVCYHRDGVVVVGWDGDEIELRNGDVVLTPWE